jgi:hypothetical protein
VFVPSLDGVARCGTDEVALIRDTIRHYAPVLIAPFVNPNSSRKNLAMIQAPANIISATRRSITPSDTPSFHPTGSATSGEISVDWRPSPAPRVGTGTVRAHLKRAWMRMRQIRPPGRGDFWIQKIAYAPSDKNLSKNGFCPLKGGSLCVKDVFAKKFFGAGRDSAGGALASVLRKHSSEGRTPDTAERCIRHCAGSRPPRGTGTCCPDSERTAPA